MAIVGPYLILKRPHYRLLLEFLQHRQKNRRVGSTHGPLDPEAIAVRDGFHKRIKELNRKGPREGDDQTLSRLRELEHVVGDASRV